MTGPRPTPHWQAALLTAVPLLIAATLVYLYPPGYRGVAAPAAVVAK